MAGDKKKVDFYMPLYIGDYLADTSHLSAEQHGAYLLLLFAAWKRDGRLPNDQLQLARIACVPGRHWQKTWGLIARFFRVDGQDLVQPRLLRELERAQRVHGGRQRGGVAAAAARGLEAAKWVRSTPVDAPQSVSANPGFSGTPFSAKSTESVGPAPADLAADPQQPEPYPEQEQTRRQSASAPPAARQLSGPVRSLYRPAHLGAATAAFLDVYDAYPNPAGKIGASQTWQDVAADFAGGEGALRDAILAQFRAGMLRQHPYASEQRYVPSLERFLRERRWEDRWQDRRPAQQPSELPESA